MSNWQTNVVKRSKKFDRQYKVLLGLVRQYLKTGKPIGSNTLKEAGFEDLSSATIRNYFSQLEEEGYLQQQHTSGGRIPTNLAFRAYAKEYLDGTAVKAEEVKQFEQLKDYESRELTTFLQKAADLLSDMGNCAVFLSAPRFDHDFIIDLKLIGIDQQRCLCAIITDFGVIQTEIIYVEKKLSAFAIKRMEAYFHWRLTGHDKPEKLDIEEEMLAQKVYNEVMMRYVVSYSHFMEEPIYRTGFSKLLGHTDFCDIAVLSESLALFENAHNMRLLLKECCKMNQLRFWIGEDLETYTNTTPNCAVVAIPYAINQQVAGGIGILGSIRMPYEEVFGMLRTFAEYVSEALTRNLYKFKISFRQPHTGHIDEKRLINETGLILLEDKRM